MLTKKSMLKKLDEATNRGVEEIKSVCSSAKSETYELRKKIVDEMNDVGSSYTKKFDATNKTAVSTLNQISKAASGITAYLDSETERVTNRLKNSIFVVTQQFIKDMDEYNKLKDEIRDQEILRTYGYYLLGVLKYPEEIKKVPLPMMAQLMDRINLYVQVSFPDVAAFPSGKVASGYTGLSSWTKYKLPALTLFLTEEFEKRALEAAKSEP